jgi:hypothetical protein
MDRLFCFPTKKKQLARFGSLRGGQVDVCAFCRLIMGRFFIPGGKHPARGIPCRPGQPARAQPTSARDPPPEQPARAQPTLAREPPPEALSGEKLMEKMGQTNGLLN